MPEENWLREKCKFLIGQKWFDHIVLIFIGLNCLTFALERPSLEDTSWQRQFLTISNYIFTGVFSLEMTIKVIAKGFLLESHAYLKVSFSKANTQGVPRYTFNISRNPGPTSLQ